MAQPSKIDTLPNAERKAVVRTLTEALLDKGEPNYRELNARFSNELKTYGSLNVSHNALYRFAAKHVIPTVSRAIAKSVDAPKDDAHVSMEKQAKEVVRDTERSLTDDPIVKAVLAKRYRLEQAIEQTHGEKQWDAYAKLEGVDLKALEMYAKATMHPGFSQQAQAGTVNQIVVMLPRQGDVQRRIEGTGVVDAEVIEPES